MSRTKTAVVVASCLIIMAPAVMAGDQSADAADSQQAREHSKEVLRMKQRDQERARDQAQERRHEDPMERARERNRKAKEKEQAEQEEGFGHDLDDDEVDGTE